MCSKAAIDLGTTSPNISFSEKKKWQELFGRPTTMCELPTGDLFDNRHTALSVCFNNIKLTYVMKYV